MDHWHRVRKAVEEQVQQFEKVGLFCVNRGLCVKMVMYSVKTHDFVEEVLRCSVFACGTRSRALRMEQIAVPRLRCGTLARKQWHRLFRAVEFWLVAELNVLNSVLQLLQYCVQLHGLAVAKQQGAELLKLTASRNTRWAVMKADSAVCCNSYGEKFNLHAINRSCDLQAMRPGDEFDSACVIAGSAFLRSVCSLFLASFSGSQCVY